MKHFILLLLSGLLSLVSFSQNDSCNIKISLLTCEQGEDLYAIFGHSALRVSDKSAGTDIVFNYGTFDFDDPDFYTKFIQGNLLYFVSTERFSNFVYEYQYENRSITEQQLNLSCERKQALYTALRVNAREENKYYHYNFLFNNCSTRLRDIVCENTGDSVLFKNTLPSPRPHFRDMLHEFLDKGNQPWSKAGIDLLLGSKIDRPGTNSEAMFLPDYLMKGFDSTEINNSPLVSSKKIILNSIPVKDNGSSFFTPLYAAIILLLIISAMGILKKKWASIFLNIFDVAFFLALGLVGCLLLFLWFGTVQYLFGNNYNLLWALPTHLPVAFVMLRNSNWVKKYFAFAAIFYLILLIVWAFLPQGMNSAFYPITLIAFIRSAYRGMKNKQP